MRRALALVLLALAGCGRVAPPVTTAAAPAAPAPPAAPDWRAIATSADRERLRGWREAWMKASDMARAAGQGKSVDAEGALLDPDRALRDPVPPPGNYLCSVIKLGSKSAGMRDYVAYPRFTCRIEGTGAVVRFDKTGGSQRPVGTIYPDGPTRAVFLGSLELGDETRPMAYGRDASRDMAGFVERVGEARWRLALPYPRFESTLDVIEITPAG